MKVSIIPSDGLVIKDGVGVKLPMTLPANIHAVQWDGVKGEIEFNDGTVCRAIGNMEEYNQLLKDHEVERVRLTNIPLPSTAKHGISLEELIDALDETLNDKKGKLISLINKVKDT